MSYFSNYWLISDSILDNKVRAQNVIDLKNCDIKKKKIAYNTILLLKKSY